MKGIISGIKRMEIHDGDGLRTTVFFKGCPLKCLWCHNPESILPKPQIAFFREKCIGCGACHGERTEIAAKNCPTEALVAYGRQMEPEELVAELQKDDVFFRQSGGGVTLSGGECLAQPTFALEVARLLSEKRISVYVDTCGFVQRLTLAAMLPYTDKFLYDIKAINPAVHKKCTGQDNAQILDNLKFLSASGSRIEVRYPLIQGYNDGEAKEIGRFLQNLPGITAVKVLKYHRFAGSRYEALGMKNTLPDTETTDFTMKTVMQTLKNYGLNVII